MAKSKANKVGKLVGKKINGLEKRTRSIRTFNLDDQLYARFKMYCVGNDLKMSAVVDQLLEGLLDEVEDR